MAEEGTIEAVVYKHYILSKIMEIYAYVLKDTLPNNHISNKSEEILKACKKFYQAFDRKIKLEGVEAIDDMSLEYFEAFDRMLSLKPEGFGIATAQIKELFENQNQPIMEVMING